MSTATLAPPVAVPMPTPAHRAAHPRPAYACRLVLSDGTPCGGRSWMWWARDGLWFCTACCMPELHRPAPQPSTPPPVCASCATPGRWSGRGAWWYCPSCARYIGSPLD